MKVSEIFTSIQGEGQNLGKPAIFLRMALCNLTCEWCDTKYTWDWKNYDYSKEVEEMSVVEVEQELLKFQGKHLVLTGGEPMLQQKELLPLLKSLKEHEFYIEVETNGTIKPTNEILALIDQWNVSPKLENSGNEVSAREKPECYRFFNHLPNACFKYVVKDPDDFEEVRRLAEKYQISNDKIILMPEAQTTEQLTERSGWLSELSREAGYRFSTRLQIALWGSKRGV
ncbi:MAG TPA: 7-carboxy-7-deazaguanine synthase QueE [Candidatus Bathyarchaeia archaeon]|nr:7-carboxy-7-deazaguanine synthase QueE [Candidatus Bathyarchaeia archaeon]